MKVLQKVILGLGLVIGSVYAQDVSNTMICQQKIGHKISNLTNHF